MILVVSEGTHMAETYNWSRFYRALCRYAPNLLVGIDEGVSEIIAMSSSSTDMFWSEGLEACLAEGAADGSLRDGVLSALEVWRENVLEALDANFGIELDWELVYLDDASAHMEALVEAASPDESGQLA
jgi:hypothetical protein